MKQLTLLELVKEVANILGSDEITSLGESVESMALSNLAITVLSNILGRDNWEFMADRMVVLTTTTDNLQYQLPNDIIEVQGVFYGTASGPQNQVAYAMPQFFTRRASLNLSGTVVTLPGGGAVRLQPTGTPARYTSFDEKSIVLFNNAPTNVVSIRARVAVDMTGAYLSPTVFNPSWIPDIPLRMFNYWLYETAAAASVDLRQDLNQRLEFMANNLYQNLRQHEPVTRLETTQRATSLPMDNRIGTFPVPQQQQQQGGGNA